MLPRPRALGRLRAFGRLHALGRLTDSCVRCERWGQGALCAACAEGPSCDWDLEIPGEYPARPPLHVLHLGSFAGPLAERVRRLKYGDETHLGATLGHALALRHGPRLVNAILLPVPLHPERLAERGYNQSALVARAVARWANASVNVDALVRCERTEAQARLGRARRLTNVQGAFVASSSARALVGRFVVLVDDVVTTGSTLDACRAALAGAGVATEVGLSVAVAERSRQGQPDALASGPHRRNLRPAHWPEWP